MNKLSQNQIDLLNKPLPKESLKPHPTKPYLTTINAIFVVERLNDVFGIGGWKIKNTVVSDSEKMVITQSFFTAWEYGIEIESFGGNDNADKGDAYKGACTDALTKIGSYLGIGADIWKNKKTDSSSSNENNQPIKTTSEGIRKEFADMVSNAQNANDIMDIGRIKEYWKNSRSEAENKILFKKTDELGLKWDKDKKTWL